MMFKFKPSSDDLSRSKIQVPYYEDARSDTAPYYDAYRSWSVPQAQNAVAVEMAKLGASVHRFVEGEFEDQYNPTAPTRLGYLIRFSYGGADGVIKVLGLPFKNKSTDRKRHAVRVQALLNVRDWLKSVVTSQVFNPGHEPLIPHLLLPDGETTIAEYVIQSGKLPLLGDGS